MKQSEAAQWAQLFQAIADGKIVQKIKPYLADDHRIDVEWEDTDTIDSRLSPSQYRIKPEPREWNLLVDSYGSVLAGSIGDNGVIFCTGSHIKPGCRTVKVREVIE